MQGVYRIRQISTNKCYIGATSNFNKRSERHLVFLRLGKHQNKNLQSAFNTHGEADFEFQIIEEVKDKENLEEREYYHLMNSENLFNIQYRDPSKVVRGKTYKQQTVISMIKRGANGGAKEVEAWGNLKKACHAHGWHSAYWTISRKDLPYTHEGWEIHRVPFM